MAVLEVRVEGRAASAPSAAMTCSTVISRTRVLTQQRLGGLEDLPFGLPRVVARPSRWASSLLPAIAAIVAAREVPCTPR